MKTTSALFHTRQALVALEAHDLGSSAAACQLQFALDLLEEQNGCLLACDRPIFLEPVG